MKVLSKYRRVFIVAAATFAQSLAAPAGMLAQTGIPLPGAPQAGYGSAPVPGSTSSAPVPGAVRTNPGGKAGSPYQQLPLSPAEAQVRIDELKSLMPDARPQDMQDNIVQLCEWLADMAEAHNKLAVSFGKNEATRPQAEAEKSACHKFSMLKNQALLLKADLLIRQQRYPEALGPLVDIVVQEPRSSTGQAAYKRLKEIGFSQEPEIKSEPKSETGPPQSTAGAPGGAAPAGQPSETAGKEAQPKTPAPVKAATPAKPAAHAAIATRPAARQTAKAQMKAPGTTAARKASKVWLTGSPFGQGSSSRR